MPQGEKKPFWVTRNDKQNGHEPSSVKQMQALVSLLVANVSTFKRLNSY